MAPEDPTAGGNPVKLDRRAARTIFMRALEGRFVARMERSDIRGRSRLSLRSSRATKLGYSGETSFSPTIPATIKPMQARRTALADSPNSAIPSSAVPIVPMPVQIA